MVVNVTTITWFIVSVFLGYFFARSLHHIMISHRIQRKIDAKPALEIFTQTNGDECMSCLAVAREGQRVPRDAHHGQDGVWVPYRFP